MKLKERKEFSMLCDKLALVGKSTIWKKAIGEMEFDGDINGIISSNGDVNIIKLICDSSQVLVIERFGKEAKIFKEYIHIYMDNRLQDKNFMCDSIGTIDGIISDVKNGRCEIGDAIQMLNGYVQRRAQDVLRYKAGSRSMSENELNIACIELDEFNISVYSTASKYKYYKDICDILGSYQVKRFIVFKTPYKLFVLPVNNNDRAVYFQLMGDVDDSSKFIGFKLQVNNSSITYKIGIKGKENEISVYTGHIPKDMEYYLLAFDIMNNRLACNEKYRYGQVIYNW